MKVFSKRLKQLREEKKRRDPKWTQEYISGILGVARPTYTAYENDTKQPPMETINKIIELLETSADYLYGQVDDPGPIKQKKHELIGFEETEFLNKMRAVASKKNIALNDPRFLELVDIAFEIAGRVNEK